MEAISIVCNNCGNEFKSTTTKAKYCGDSCRVKAHRERRAAEPQRMRRCPGCYQPFYPKNAKRRYCSDACKMKTMRRHDWDGKYGPKKGVEPLETVEPIQVTYNEREAINAAWSEALD